jgi:hypothetical protein
MCRVVPGTSGTTGSVLQARPHPLQLSGLPQELVTTLGGAYAGSDRKSSRICAQPHPGYSEGAANALEYSYVATWVQKIRCMQENPS